MHPTQLITHLFQDEWVSVLIGHPEFEILFSVEHIAELGLVRNPSATRALVMEETKGYGFMQFKEIITNTAGSIIYSSFDSEGDEGSIWLASAAETYRVLLRADSPVAPTFREWVLRNVVPDVKEIDPTLKPHAPLSSTCSEAAQMKLKIRMLERELDAERRRTDGLKKSLEENFETLIMALDETLSLRKGIPYLKRLPGPEGLLERMQWEQDQHSRKWLNSQMQTEMSFHRVDIEERWWRSTSARERREAFARILRKE